MGVRHLAEADIPKAADLYWTFLAKEEGTAPPSVWSSFRELYFANPLVDRGFPSLVYEDNSGRIVGFLGVIGRNLSICGRSIRSAFGGNLVVHPDARSSFAAARLLDVYTKGPYDLLQADSANDNGRRLLDRLGFRTIPALNIHWVRPLRPAHYLAYYGSRTTGPLASTVKLAAKPFCSIADAIAERLPGSPLRLTKSTLKAGELDIDMHLHCMAEFRKGYSMWAEYDADSLKWLLDYMDRTPRRGRLRKLFLRNDTEQIVGYYVYYVQPGGIGEVIQIGGDPRFTKLVLDHLLADAMEHGVIALHGVVDLRRMADFSDKGCFFTCRGGWALAYSKTPELLDVLERGDALLSRLDGEWCLHPGI
jgi:ribosomal protein S18 acetylase RimI-like enzyme